MNKKIKKLTLNRTTLRNLGRDGLRQAAGGRFKLGSVFNPECLEDITFTCPTTVTANCPNESDDGNCTVMTADGYSCVGCKA